MEALLHSLKGLGKAMWSKGQTSKVPGTQNQSCWFLTHTPTCSEGSKYILLALPVSWATGPPTHSVYTPGANGLHSPQSCSKRPTSAHAYPPSHCRLSESPVGLPNWSNRGLVNHKCSDKNRGCNDSSCKSYSYVLDKCHQQLHWQMWPPHASWTLNSQSKLQSDGNSSLRGPANIRGPKIKWSVWS